MSVSREELFRVANDYIDIGNEPDCVKRDCDFLCYLFENCEIILPENNRFFVVFSLVISQVFHHFTT